MEAIWERGELEDGNDQILLPRYIKASRIEKQYRAMEPA